MVFSAKTAGAPHNSQQEVATKLLQHCSMCVLQLLLCSYGLALHLYLCLHFSQLQGHHVLSVSDSVLCVYFLITLYNRFVCVLWCG